MAEQPFLLTRLMGTGVVSLQAARGGAAALLEHAPARLGVALRDGPHRVCGAGMDSLGIGVERWLLVRYDAPPGWGASVSPSVADCAAVCDQSDGYVIFSASGTEVREVLGRAVAVDLRPNVLLADDVAVTNMGHINVILWRLETADSPHFCLAVGRSYADSFESLLRSDGG